MHKYAFLYKYHAVHHNNHAKTSEMNWLSVYHAHWIETPFQGAGAFVPALYMTWKAMVFSWVELLLLIGFLNIRGMIQHEPRLSNYFGNHHILHHEHLMCNYGQPWVDAIAGTSYKEKNHTNGIFTTTTSTSSSSSSTSALEGDDAVSYTDNSFNITLLSPSSSPSPSPSPSSSSQEPERARAFSFSEATTRSRQLFTLYRDDLPYP